MANECSLREAEFDNMARSRQEIAPALAEGPLEM